MLSFCCEERCSVPTGRDSLLTVLSINGACLKIGYERNDSASRSVNVVYQLDGVRVSHRLVRKCLAEGLLERYDSTIIITEKGRHSVPNRDTLVVPDGIQLSPLENKKYGVRLNELIKEANLKDHKLTPAVLNELRRIALSRLTLPLQSREAQRGGVVVAVPEKPPYAQGPVGTKRPKLPSHLRKPAKVNHRQ